MLTFIASALQLIVPFSPIAVIGLLAIIIYLLVQNQQQVTGKVENLGTNHLHELPEMAETLRRIEIIMVKEFSYIRARLNGHDE